MVLVKTNEVKSPEHKDCAVVFDVTVGPGLIVIVNVALT